MRRAGVRPGGELEAGPDGSGAARPMLHAARLGFTHPETGQPMSWEAKPPADFAALWGTLRRNKNQPHD